MEAAINSLFTMGINAKFNENKDTGIKSYILEDKQIQISLIQFAEFGKNKKIYGITPDPYFSLAIERFNLRMTYRVMKDIGAEDADAKKLLDTYYISKLDKEIKLGKTPLSNTAILKELQSIVDGILFKDNGKGVNVYKVSSHDVAYILNTMTRRGKTSGSVVCPRLQTMATLIMDMLHKIYTAEYVHKKAESASAVTSEKTKEKIESLLEGYSNSEQIEILEQTKELKRAMKNQDMENDIINDALNATYSDIE